MNFYLTWHANLYIHGMFFILYQNWLIFHSHRPAFGHIEEIAWCILILLALSYDIRMQRFRLVLRRKLKMGIESALKKLERYIFLPGPTGHNIDLISWRTSMIKLIKHPTDMKYFLLADHAKAVFIIYSTFNCHQLWAAGVRLMWFLLFKV